MTLTLHYCIPANRHPDMWHPDIIACFEERTDCKQPNVCLAADVCEVARATRRLLTPPGPNMAHVDHVTMRVEREAARKVLRGEGL